jgi:penicillin-binding protein 1C
MPIPHVDKKKKSSSAPKKKANATQSAKKKTTKKEKPAEQTKKKKSLETKKPAKKGKKKGSGAVTSKEAWKGLKRKERKAKIKKELGNASSRKQKRKIKKAAHKGKPFYKRWISFRFLWKFGAVMSILGLAAGVAGGFWLYNWVSADLASIEDIENRAIAKTTKIYASDGETLLYEVGDNQRIDTTLDKIDDDIEHAVLSIEDKRFYEHGAVDYYGISRAAFNNVANRDATGEGASTLTQQFAKNVALSNEQTYERKLKEVVLAVRLEQKYSKDEILEYYLNDIYFGANIQGVEAAAQEYFDKSAEEVSIAEAATLAALPQNPVYMLSNPDALEYRKNNALDIMLEEGYISEKEAETAKAEKVKVVEEVEDTISDHAPHFANYVNSILEAQFGQNTVRRGGLNVVTTIDLDYQKTAQSVIEEGMANVESYGGSNASLVHIDPKTGFIKAMVGSRDFYDTANDGQVNVATSLQQPGSSLKPFAYMLAFSKGFTPETKVWDVETDFLSVAADGSVSGGPYRPRNYSLGQAGPVTMRSALATSLNIPAVKALYLGGMPDFLDMVERFGYSSFDPERVGLSIILGGAEVTLVEHTNAYATLAADGMNREAVSIQKITDQNGEVVYEWKDEPERAMKAEHVRTLTNVLSDIGARGGSFFPLTLSDYRPFAAKTGTTDEYRDAWTMGYTPSAAAGIWAGNNDNTPMANGAAGLYVAAPMLTDYFERITAGTEAEDFVPAEYSAANSVLGGNIFSGAKDIRVDRVTGLRIPDDCPAYPEEFIETKEERVGHSILYYLDKANPTVLSNIINPGYDPMFDAWEKAIGNRTEGEFSTGGEQGEEDSGAIPDEFMPCDARDEASEPSVELALSSTNYTQDNFRFFANVTAIGSTTVQFFIDGNLVDQQSFDLGDQQTTVPTEAGYSAATLTAGNHTASVIVTDAAGRSAQTSVGITFDGGDEAESGGEPDTDEAIDDESIIQQINDSEGGDDGTDPQAILDQIGE